VPTPAYSPTIVPALTPSSNKPTPLTGTEEQPSLSTTESPGLPSQVSVTSPEPTSSPLSIATQSPLVSSVPTQDPQGLDSRTSAPVTLGPYKSPVTDAPKEVAETESPIGPLRFSVSPTTPTTSTGAPSADQSRIVETQAPSGPPALAPVLSPLVGTLSPVPLVSQACSEAMLVADLDNADGFLSQEEFLVFIQTFSDCRLTTELSSEQNSIFQALACACLGDPDEGVDCCFPGMARVSIGGSPHLAQDPNYLVDVCFQAESTFGDECVASPTTAPLVSEDLDQCSQMLSDADGDKDGLLDQDEYLLFVQDHGQCDLITSLDLGHQAVFQTLACDCVNSPGATFECCLPGNARLNTSGADVLEMNRTTEQTTALSRICISANGLTARECAVPPTVIPHPADCVDVIGCATSSVQHIGLFLSGEARC
jgi:hypothetical protein